MTSVLRPNWMTSALDLAKTVIIQNLKSRWYLNIRQNTKINILLLNSK